MTADSSAPTIVILIDQPIFERQNCGQMQEKTIGFLPIKVRKGREGAMSKRNQAQIRLLPLLLLTFLPCLLIVISMANPQACQCVEDTSNIPAKAPQHNAFPRRHNTLGALFAIDSAQDLRALSIENEIRERASPRGVLKVGKNSVESVLGPAEEGGPGNENLFIGSKSLSSWQRQVRKWRKKSLEHLYTFPLPMPRIPGIETKNAGERVKDDLNPYVDTNLCTFKAAWKIFSISELKAATNNFSQENLIGKGGFAEVYKGRLKDGQLVAVKRLARGAHEDKTSSFLSELGIIVHVDNPHTAKLIGYGVEAGLHLVLQLYSLGSLASILNGPREKLDWSARYKIALGTADGLLYLHEGCQRRIIHRDIKADNILLTETYVAQICDFGLAMWLPRQCAHHAVFKFEGTFGYSAPEYLMHGIVDEKIDVYSFGVLLLELITGHRALDSSRESILTWAKPLLRNNELKELIDPCLGDNYDDEELDRMALTASLCVEHAPVLRPQMSQAIILLRGDEEVKGRRQRTMHKTYPEELLDAREYNSTKHVSDLRRHRQLVFDS